MKLRRLELVLITVLLFIMSHSLNVEGAVTGTALLDTSTNRTFVPIRFVSEHLGAEVNWVAKERAVYIKDKTKQIKLTIGERTVEVNKKKEPIDAAPFIKDDTTYVPLRFVSTILGTEPKWDARTATVLIKMNNKEIVLSTVRYHSKNESITRTNPITETARTFKIGEKSFKANIISVDLTNPAIDLKVGLAMDRIGEVEALADIASRHKATIAMNGTYFDAYTDSKEPYGMIIVDGKVLHIGKERSVFSFDSKNNTDFSIMNPEVIGATNGSTKPPYNWYSYAINRTPQKNSGASVVIYTPDRGEKVGFNYGTNVIVENGKVKDIVSNQDVNIPKNGFVINLIGSEVHNLLSRFTKGTSVTYEVTNFNSKLEEIEGAIGAGPRLLMDGKVSLDFEKEGFKDEQIKIASAARSAIGVTKDQKLLLVTTTSTINELADIMKQAGAYQAMNLDGGASSGLYYNGKYVKTPGRNVSNALLIIQK